MNIGCQPDSAAGSTGASAASHSAAHAEGWRCSSARRARIHHAAHRHQQGRCKTGHWQVERSHAVPLEAIAMQMKRWMQQQRPRLAAHRAIRAELGVRTVDHQGQISIAVPMHRQPIVRVVGGFVDRAHARCGRGR